MKKKILLTTLVISALLTTKTSTAQLNYGITLSGGLSKVDLVENDLHTGYGRYFTAAPQAAFDFFVSEKLKTKPISFEQGISIETFATMQNMSKADYEYILLYFPDFGPRVYESRTWQLAVPLKVKYEVNNWFAFFVGVNNIFFIKNSLTTNKKYALRGEIGTDFLLAKRYIIGIEGGYDILPSGHIQNENIFFHFYHASAKVGILLSSFKK